MSPSNILVLEQFAHTVFIYIHFIIEVSVCVIFCVNCHFQNIICKNYNSFSNFIVLVHKQSPHFFVHPAKYKKRQGIPAVKIICFWAAEIRSAGCTSCFPSAASCCRRAARRWCGRFSGPTPAAADRPHPVRGRPLYNARTAAWQNRPDCTPPP